MGAGAAAAGQGRRPPVTVLVESLADDGRDHEDAHAGPSADSARAARRGARKLWAEAGVTSPEVGRTYEQVGFRAAPGSTEVLLVRHGQSALLDPAKPFGLVDGRGDPELSALGRQQALLLRARLRRAPLTAIYVTPLRRTSETVAPLADALGLVPTIEPDLTEVHVGEWEGGLYRMHVAEGDPKALEVMRAKRWDVIPGAEPNEALERRTTAALQRIAQRHPDEQVLVVAHAGSIAALLAHAAEAPIFGFLGAENASLSSVVVGPGGWVLRRFNDTTHLEFGLT